MMATAAPQTSSSLLPLLECLEDSTAGYSEQTDAYLTVANRLSGEEAREFLPAVVKHFPRLGKTILSHITSTNAELNQAALQALGFCVFHAQVVSGVPASFNAEILSALSSLVVKSTDKNTCTRALWVLSKQSFPTEVVSENVLSILSMLERVQTREDIQSALMEHEALNVVVRLLEQAPTEMGEAAVRWAKLVVPLVVHSAPRVRLRAAASLELGLPLLLKRQSEVSTVIEPLMAAKLVPELQKLFSAKNETNVLKLWPLFVKLLGKLLHRGGPFINSLLHLEELGFRSSSPNVKKIAFIAWKSLIDNFALNPDILCSGKRLKLLMQPLSSIQVRTEALLLTKLEVWWYLVIRLGPNLSANFDQVSVPLLQCCIGPDSPSAPGTPARGSSQNGSVGTATPKTGPPSFSSPAGTPRLNLNSSVHSAQLYPSIRLLGLEMLLHYFLGRGVVTTAAKSKLALSLEPLTHPFLTAVSSFTKHATVLISLIRDGFITIGKDAPDTLLVLIWESLVSYVNQTIESAGNKKDRQGSEVLTQTLQALQSIVSSEALPAHKVLLLLETTLKGLPQRVLSSASYQVGKMDVLTGTPALFLILLFFNNSLVPAFVEDERYFVCLEAVVSCGLSGPASPLAFGEAMLSALGRCASSIGNKEQLWRMWSVLVNPLTDTITQTNEVNQGDALEHNFSSVHTALMFPITHLLPGQALPHMTQKSMLASWSRLYKTFARCSALVATAEENVCCEELCSRMAPALDKQSLAVPPTLDAVASMLHVIVESVNFSPYTPQFQQKRKSPHTPLTWVRRKSKTLGNLSTFQSLLVQSLEAHLAPEHTGTASEGTGLALVSVLSTLFTNLALATAVQEALTSLTRPLTLLYQQTSDGKVEEPKFSNSFGAKLEKLLGDLLGCLQTRSNMAYDDELLALLSPLLCVLFLHKSKPLRTLVLQFWNATFASATLLTYPDELKPVLNQVKQKTPILLPGFEAVTIPDLSEQYSSESSQLDTKLSGVQMSSVGKRDSLLAQSGETIRNSKTPSKPVSAKLNFGSPKPLRREVLEEESSMDFVFIPPETKERVLTEHQKEVKRTKRADIPAMYNNLDASLDTTVFSQYTQSQEESMDKLSTDDGTVTASKDKAVTEVLEENMEIEYGQEVFTDETQDFVNSKNKENIEHDSAKDNEPAEKVILPDSADVSMVDAGENDSVEDIPNVSGSSDMISGTPQKPNSRRQSFITLEKYAETKSSSPVNVKTFTGPHTRTSHHQEPSTSLSEASLMKAHTDTPLSEPEEKRQESSKDVVPESIRQEEVESESKRDLENAEPRQCDGTEEEDNVIPDTQAEVKEEKRSPAKEMAETNSQTKESEDLLDDSQGSPSSSSPIQGEPRRSGRRRSRPLRPGEKPEEQEEKDVQKKTKQKNPLTKESQKDSSKTPDSQSQRRISRRTNQAHDAVEEDSHKEKQRKPSHDHIESNSQLSATPTRGVDANIQGRVRVSRRIQLLSSSEELLVKGNRKSGDELSQSDNQADSDPDNQSQGRRSKLAAEVDEESDLKPRSRAQTEDAESSQIDSPGSAVSPPECESPGTVRTAEVSDSQESVPVDQTKEREGKVEPSENKSQIDTQSAAAQTNNQPQGRSSRRSKLGADSVEQLKDQGKSRGGAGDRLSQGNTPVLTPSEGQSGSQPQGRSTRRNKVLSEVSELSGKVDYGSDSQSDRGRGRPSRRGKSLDGQTKFVGSPSSSPLVQTEIVSIEGTQDSSQGKGRYSTRRACQGLTSSAETSESDALETRDKVQKPPKRTRQLKSGPPPSPLTVPMEPAADTNTGDSKSSQKADPVQTSSSNALALTPLKDIEDSLKSQEVLVSKHSLDTKNIAEQRETETQMDVEEAPVVFSSVVPVISPVVPDNVEREKQQPPLSTDSSVTSVAEVNSQLLSLSPAKRVHRQRASKISAKLEDAASEDSDVCESQLPEALECHNAKASQPQETLSADLVEQTNSPVPTDALTLQDNVFMEPNIICTPPLPNGSPADTAHRSQTAEKLSLSLQISESSEEKLLDLPQPEKTLEEAVTAEPVPDVDCPQPSDVVPETSGVVEQDQPAADDSVSIDEIPPESASAVDKEAQEDEEEPFTSIKNPLLEHVDASTSREVETDVLLARDQVDTPLPERSAEDNAAKIECDKEAETQIEDHDELVLASVAPLPDVRDDKAPALMTFQDVCPGSPPKQNDVEAVSGPEVGQSPSRGRSKGTWSPSASPSTSILKRAQKRPLKEDTPSPLLKSRRVSFADPIQHQELADDIDRRSPIIRTNSPRTKTSSAVPQPKYVTTPTKGLLILSPRNLRSPGFKSSKKCLISEMGQEPRAIPKNCVYPSLVSCSTPVEAVLPQITSNMWPRGFGQLVRARNIKTVGDLSALTPSEVKNLPIRSPKISNVKKALRAYHEQQRKVRGGDELKSFDEMEKMTSELEETSTPHNQEEEEEEEGKSPGETLATELVDENVSTDHSSGQESLRTQTLEEQQLVKHRPEGPLQSNPLLSDVEVLASKMTPEELGQFSPEQLVQLHDQLGGMMRSVVLQLQSRLC
ncbi:telomere-associated protein RIF1 [Aplochiton taeniatus]